MQSYKTDETIRLSISKLDAATDVAPLGKALKAVPGVSETEIVPETNQAVVRQRKVEPKKLTEALR